jgi:hypothetical protein
VISESSRKTSGEDVKEGLRETLETTPEHGPARVLATDYVVRARVEPRRLLMGASRERSFSLLFHLLVTASGHQGLWMCLAKRLNFLVPGSSRSPEQER